MVSVPFCGLMDVLSDAVLLTQVDHSSVEHYSRTTLGRYVTWVQVLFQSRLLIAVGVR
jgi:hypothetical protein